MKKSIIQVSAYRASFVEAMEHERWNRNLSIGEMAELVGLSKSSYHRIINDDTEAVPFRVVMHVHHLTGLPMWQLCGMPMPPEFKFSIFYLKLNSEHKEIIDKMIRVLLDMEKEQP